MNMKRVIPIKPFQRPHLQHHQDGFTLVELMVGMVVATIVAIGVFSAHRTTTHTVMTQRQVADMQQQMRGSMFVMEREIRAAGYDPIKVGTPATPLGVQDIRRYNIVANPNPVGAGELNLAGSPALTVDFDLDADGVVEQSTYLLYDIDNNGITDFARRNGGACFELMAESIEAIGFAYAVDADFDGAVDLSPNGHILWVVDSDNNNELDRALDVDDDGDIEMDDLTAPVLNMSVPHLNNETNVPVDRIRMVRIWLLSRSARSAKKKMIDQNTYLVGDQIIGPFNDTFRRRTLEMSIRIRNL